MQLGIFLFQMMDLIFYPVVMIKISITGIPKLDKSYKPSKPKNILIVLDKTQSSNFLIGSGASTDYFETLNMVENLLTELNDNQHSIDEDNFKIKKMIFMSSIIYPTHDYTEMNEESEFLYDEKKRIGYIEKIVKLIRQKI